jgi:hypothetical protein
MQASRFNEEIPAKTARGGLACAPNKEYEVTLLQGIAVVLGVLMYREYRKWK